jgi:hypothetical protein
MAADISNEAMDTLRARNALPSWFSHTLGWAKKYHRSLTSPQGYTEDDRNIRHFAPIAGLEIRAGDTTIVMSDRVPAFLRGMLDVIDVATFRSENPDDPIKLSWAGIQQAAGRLGQIVGSMRDADIPLFPVPADPWTPGVIAASHFCYLHEFYHIMLQHRSHHSTFEERWANEFQADELAFVHYARSLSSHPELEERLVFFGPVLALYFAELREFATDKGAEEARSSHPPVLSRIAAIRDMVRSASNSGLLKTNPLPLGDFNARLLNGLLLMVSSVDYPIFLPVEESLRTLITDVQGGSLDRLRASTNHVLQWYFLADWQRLTAACHRALGAILTDEPGLFELLQSFLSFIRTDAAEILAKHAVVDFLESRCLFDREFWEAAE